MHMQTIILVLTMKICSGLEYPTFALFGYLTNFRVWRWRFIATEIKRLDLCANIRLKDQPAAERYLKLMRKGGHYRGLNTKEMPLDPVSHRHKHPENEVRYVNGSYSRNGIRETLYIYLKYPQMQERSYLYDAGEIEQAKGQVRFELRVKAPKLRYLKKSTLALLPSNSLTQYRTSALTFLAPI